MKKVRWHYTPLPEGIQRPRTLVDAVLAYLRAADGPREYYAIRRYAESLYGASWQGVQNALRTLRRRGDVVKVAQGQWRAV